MVSRGNSNLRSVYRVANESRFHWSGRFGRILLVVSTEEQNVAKLECQAALKKGDHWIDFRILSLGIPQCVEHPTFLTADGF